MKEGHKMKKLIALLLLFAACVLTACGTSTDSSETSTSNTEPATSIETIQVEIEFDPINLVAAYCDGTWDGAFVFNAEHCASIENGSLWLDCEEQEQIPDMGIHEDCFWLQVLSSDDEGTWVQDRDLGTVSLWKKGTRLKELRTNSTYYTSVYKLDSCLVVREGDFIQTWTLEGYRSDSMSHIVDCYLNEDGEVFCSNYEHENFRINEDGSFEKISSTYIRFPRTQSTLIYNEENSELIEEISNRYIYTDWDGSIQVLDEGIFVAVDFYNNIIVNNKIVGNLSLPSNLEGAEGGNLHFSYNQAYWLDGEKLRFFSEGKETHNVDVPDGDAELLWIEKGLIVAQTYNGETNTLFIIRDNAYQIVSESCVDCNMAYDTLYYMEGNTVYTLNINDANASPETFFEGAYAVSPFSDEGEGALVHWEQANFECYGYNNIYSPYGIPWSEKE